MDSMNIDNKFHLYALSALTSFMEKTGFDDFRYTIQETFSGNVTCYELSLVDNQGSSLLDIRVKTIRHSSDDYDVEVETNGETFKVYKITTDSILEAIRKSIETYVASKNVFLKNISKGFKTKKGDVDGQL